MAAAVSHALDSLADQLPDLRQSPAAHCSPRSETVQTTDAHAALLADDVTSTPSS